MAESQQEPKKTRDNFPESVRERLAAEVGYRCSLPDCGAPTIGPSATEPKGVNNSGVAAHITAAAPKGPRYDSSLTPEERASHENGVHCCPKHARIVDNDPSAYSVAQLRQWKADAIDLQRRAHSTGDIDPNGRIKLARATRNDIASRAMKAAIRCRAAVMTGFYTADEAKNIRRVPSNQSQTINLMVEKWASEMTRALADANEALMDMRVHWDARTDTPPGLIALVDLIAILEEWRMKFFENMQRILDQPHTKRDNFGPCDWNGVFTGDAAQRKALQDAIDAASSKVERWAAPYIVSRDA